MLAVAVIFITAREFSFKDYCSFVRQKLSLSFGLLYVAMIKSHKCPGQ